MARALPSAPDAEARETRRAGRAAFYALRPGGWRDYVTLLHPPYTAWHLSYVCLGAVAAPHLHLARLGATLLAFFLAVGVAAHALDERMGRPLGTGIRRGVLSVLAAASLALAVALGLAGSFAVSWWLLAFVAFGSFIVLAYNLELAGGRFHGDTWFALAWGGFPALTSFFAQAGTIRWEGVLVAAACCLLSAAQRTLSTPVRLLRRRVDRVEGRIVLLDGTALPLSSARLRAGPEAALRAMVAALVLLAAGLVVARVA